MPDIECIRRCHGSARHLLRWYLCHILEMTTVVVKLPLLVAPPKIKPWLCGRKFPVAGHLVVSMKTISIDDFFLLYNSNNFFPSLSYPVTRPIDGCTYPIIKTKCIIKFVIGLGVNADTAGYGQYSHRGKRILLFPRVNANFPIIFSSRQFSRASSVKWFQTEYLQAVQY